MNRVTVLTKWTSNTGANVADVVRYPGAWTDDTGQRDDQISPDPNVVVFYGEVDDVTLDALEADADVIVLQSEVIIDGGA